MQNGNGMASQRTVDELERLLAEEERSGGAPATSGDSGAERQALGLLVQGLAPEKAAVATLGRQLRLRVLQQLAEEAPVSRNRSVHAPLYRMAAAAGLLLTCSFAAWFALDASGRNTASSGAFSAPQAAHQGTVELIAGRVTSTAPGEAVLIEGGSFDGALTISTPVRLHASRGLVRLGAT